MSRFNTAAQSTKVTNKAGGEAYAQSPQLEFVSMLLTSFVQNQYYRSADDGLDRLRELMLVVDPLFAAKAAVYARNEFGMRSISHAVAAELFRMGSNNESRVKRQGWVAPFLTDVVRRPDDATEIYSYYKSNVRQNADPAMLKKGLAASLTKFDAYQLAKYKGDGKEVSLIDLVNLTHPQETEAIKALMTGTLKSADTWNTGLVKAGQKAETDKQKDEFKADVWRNLLKEKKLPYFALLRNLRNIAEQAPDMVMTAASQLKDEAALRKSLVLPFRFFSAYKELSKIGGPGSRVLIEAVSSALDMAVHNMPDFGSDTLVVVDHSGSMNSGVSEKSLATHFEIGALFGVALAKKSNADFMYFGDIAKYYNVTNDSTLGQMRWLNACNNSYSASDTEHAVGHGTNFSAIFDEANRAYKRVFIFSDMQSWGGHYTPQQQFKDYKQRTGADPKVFSFDLAGYGSMQFPERNVFTLAGFSDKILDVIKLIEQDKNALINKIEEVTFSGS